MKIGIYISELLFDHDKVILPGFGMFTTQYVPARFIPEQKKVESPSKIISFNETVKQGETPLIEHISKKEQATTEEVSRFIADFVEQMHQTLNAGKKVELRKVGVFSKSADSNILFEPDKSINYLNDVSGLSSVKEPEKTNQESDFLPPIEPADKTVENNNSTYETSASDSKEVETREYSGEKTINAIEGKSNEQAPSQGLPSALKWLAYTVVPLLIIIIIIGFNFRYFFGEGGIFRSSDEPVEQVQVTQAPASTEQAEEAQGTSEQEMVSENNEQEDNSSAPPPAPEEGRAVYHIVVGSFENHHQAEAYAENLRKEGADLAGIYMQTPSGFYRVSYGYYYDLQQAEDMLKKVQQQVNQNAWLLHR